MMIDFQGLRETGVLLFLKMKIESFALVLFLLVLALGYLVDKLDRHD